MLLDLLDNKTIVFITHQLSTQKCNKIIVLDDGEIIGVGSHDELIKSTKYFKK